VISRPTREPNAKSRINALDEGDLHPDQVKLIAKRLGVTEQDVVDMNRRLGGGCQVPIAGYAELDGDELWLRGLVASTDGHQVLRAEGRASREDGESLGRRVAEDLLNQGAEAILAEVYANA